MSFECCWHAENAEASGARKRSRSAGGRNGNRAPAAPQALAPRRKLARDADERLHGHVIGCEATPDAPVADPDLPYLNIRRDK